MMTRYEQQFYGHVQQAKQDQLHGSSIWYPHEKAKAERYRDWHRERGHKAKVFKRFIRVGGFHIEVYVAVVWVKKKQTKEELLASLEGDK